MNNNQVKKRDKVSADTVKRLMKYVAEEHKIRFFLVLVCILISAVASVADSLFSKTLIDDYISPLLLEDNPVLTGLLKRL